MSLLGRFGKGNKILVHHNLFGVDGANPVALLIMTMEGNSVSPFSLNPCMPRALKAVKIGVLANTAVDLVPGNWTMRLRLNETFGPDIATFSFAVSTGVNPTAGSWSAEPVIQAGERYYITCDGPNKNGIAVRATLEFEVI